MTSHSDTIDFGAQKLAELQQLLDSMPAEQRARLERLHSIFGEADLDRPGFLYLGAVLSEAACKVVAEADPELAGHVELDPMLLCEATAGACGLVVQRFAAFLQDGEQSAPVSVHDLEPGTHVEFDGGARGIVMRRDAFARVGATHFALYSGAVEFTSTDREELVRVIIPAPAEE